MSAVASAQFADAVSLDLASGECKLTIFEYLPWDRAHLGALQGKINDCLQFIESGEIYASYPQSQERDFVIDVRSIYAPDDGAQNFLSTAQQVLDEAGYLLRFGPLGSTYAEAESILQTEKTWR
ncbi:MAG TPA: DUF6572 domain-containing protein [Herminiimonas sp.]|nr:DUF6572 domain-containing protein [Herminiimonas sp.]